MEFTEISDGVTRDLGAGFVELAPERAAKMPVGGGHHRPFGYLHGGVSVVLAESVASSGGFLSCRPGKMALGLGVNACPVRPKSGGTLAAVGKPVYGERKSRAREVRITGESDKLVCVTRRTVAAVGAGR